MVVHHPLGISKNLKEIGVNKDTGEKELIWTIVAGAANEDYGPAWIGDILSGSLDGQKSPKRVKLTYEHSFNGKRAHGKKLIPKILQRLQILRLSLCSLKVTTRPALIYQNIIVQKFMNLERAGMKAQNLLKTAISL